MPIRAAPPSTKATALCSTTAACLTAWHGSRRRCWRLDSRRGDRVAIFMRNHPAYLEVLYGAWWAGLVVGARQRQAALSARGAVDRRPRAGALGFRDADVAPAWRPLPAPWMTAGPDYEALFSSAAGAGGRSRAGRPGVAVLHSGTTGKPKGVMLTHRNLMTMGLTYFVDVDAIESARRDRLRGADVAWRRPLRDPARDGRRAARRPGVSGGVRSGRAVRVARTRCGRLSMFAAPTIVKRLVDHAEPTGADCSGLQDHRLRRRAHVRGGHRARDPRHGAALRPDLRPGRKPDGDHRIGRVRTWPDTGHPRHAERIASVGVAQTPVEVKVATANGDPQPSGGVGEVTRAWRHRHGGLLARSRRDGSRSCRADGS